VANRLEDSEIGRLVVERRLATSDEVQAAAEEQRRQARNGHLRPLGEYLVERGFLTRTQLGRLIGGNEDSGVRPAQQIPGYQILNKVGAGAMATVYRARQISLDRIVAIKVLPRRLSEDQEFVSRFYREGRAAAQLNHNNIVQAIDVGESGGFHYFVMEFVEGCTVYDELASGKVFHEPEAVDIITQIARALHHAHQRGFVHRDVKPKNIMLTTQRVAKLADMGLAREMTDLEAAMAEAGRAYGTPYYISPEQIRGQMDIDHRADVYSLGATFYHMVTGRVPFEAPTPSAVMHKHLKEPLMPPDHLNESLTSGCATLIEKTMAKDREERYPGAAELLVDLELLARGQAPRYAAPRLAPEMLETLAEGQAEREPLAEDEAPPAGGQRVAMTITLSVLLLISILLNLFLFALH
jgi:serine/threonine-protein kinase